MILSSDQTKPLINADGFYDCKLVNQKFAFKIMRDDVSPLGNVICFRAPTVLGPLKVDDALIIVAELPNTDTFGGVCFLRLYLTQIGSWLSATTGKECFVDESSLFIDGKQASISVLNKVKDSVVFHIVFANNIYEGEIANFSLSEDQLTSFQNNVKDMFSHLTKSIFIETCRDDF